MKGDREINKEIKIINKQNLALSGPKDYLKHHDFRVRVAKQSMCPLLSTGKADCLCAVKWTGV